MNISLKISPKIHSPKVTTQTSLRLNVLKSMLFRAPQAFQAKICSKKDKRIIFFSSESWDVAFSKSDNQEAFRRPPDTLFYFEILNFYENFKTKIDFSFLNRAAGGLLKASWVPDLQKATSQLSLEKKLSFHLFLNRFCVYLHEMHQSSGG